MKHFKLNFGNRSILEQIAICRRVADGVAKLPADHRAAIADVPVADSVTEAADAHAQVEALKIQLRAALKIRDTKVRAMRDHTTGVALGISAVTDDPAVMLAAGLDIAKEKRPVGRPDAPSQLRAVPTDFEGEVRLRWKRSVRRCWFDVQATTDPAATTGWKKILTCFKQSCEVKELKSGVKYWFRISAGNAHGQGPWSQPVSAWVK